MDYDVMSDQEWEPEEEDGEDIMVRGSLRLCQQLTKCTIATTRRMLPISFVRD